MTDNRFTRARAASPGRRRRILMLVMLLLAGAVYWMSRAEEMPEFRDPDIFISGMPRPLPAFLNMLFVGLFLAMLMMFLKAVVLMRMKFGALALRLRVMLATAGGAAVGAMIGAHILVQPPERPVIIDDGYIWDNSDAPEIPVPAPLPATPPSGNAAGV